MKRKDESDLLMFGTENILKLPIIVAICPLTATEEARRANVRIRFIVDDIV